MPLSLKPRGRDLLFVVLVFITTILWRLFIGPGFPLDDSWIHQSIARNLAESGQWAVIPGQVSAASTSPLYTLLLALGYAIGFPYPQWTQMLGVLALGLAGALGARMADKVAPNVRGVGLATGMLIIFSWHLLWAALSGMETALFAALTLLLMVLAWRELDADQGPRSGLGSGLAFGVASALTALTRPEGVALAALIVLALIIARPGGSWARVVRWLLAGLAGFVLVIAPYVLLNWQLTGGLLPSTAPAKLAQHAPLLALPYFVRLWQMLLPLAAGGQVLLLPAVVVYVVVIIRREDRRSAVIYLLPLLWALLLLLLYAVRLPAAYQHGRYVIPALPAFIIAGGVGMLWVIEWGAFAVSHLQPRPPDTWRNLWGYDAPMKRILTRVLAVAVTLVVIIHAVVVGPQAIVLDVGIINEEMVQTAFWIDDNLPDDALLALHDIGAVAYFAPRPLLDIAGLISPEVVPLLGDPEALWALMEDRGAQYLMAFPYQIPGGDPDDPRLCELYTSPGESSAAVGGPSMAVYALAYDGDCQRD